MLIKFTRLVEKLSGMLLGSFAATVPLGNVLICVTLIVFGPSVMY